jgi:hypothetical protein
MNNSASLKVRIPRILASRSKKLPTSGLAKPVETAVNFSTASAGTTAGIVAGGALLPTGPRVRDSATSFVSGRAAPPVRVPHVLSAFPFIDGPDDRY